MTHFRIPARQQNARTVALQVLQQSRSHDAFVQELLDRHLSRSPLSNADRRLATQLACGVLRRRGTLDALLRPFINRRPDQVDPVIDAANLELSNEDIATIEAER